MAIALYQDHPLLPASAPPGHAQILETNPPSPARAVDIRSIQGHKLCDFVATLLHNLPDHPNALQDFFDPEVTSFLLIRRYKYGATGRTLPYVIWRRNKKVTCGCIDDVGYDPEEKVAWNTFTMSTLSSVAPDAVWRVTWGAWTAYTKPHVRSLWSQNFTTSRKRPPFFTFNSEEDAREAEEIAFQFGRDLYVHEDWTPHARMEIEVEVEREESEDGIKVVVEET